MLPPLPTARSGLAAAALSEQVYVTGGEALDGSGHTFAELEVLDTAAGTWRTATPMPTARLGLAAVAYDDQMYELAGGPISAVSVRGANDAFVP